MRKHRIREEARKHTDRPSGLMILCFLILPNPSCKKFARPAQKQNVSSTDFSARDISGLAVASLVRANFRDEPRIDRRQYERRQQRGRDESADDDRGERPLQFGSGGP